MKRINGIVILSILLSFFNISFNPAVKKTITVQVVFEFNKTVATVEDARERAVAFHSITFIDSVGYTISEITFGTSEANTLQGDGWFENETSTDVGSFQWAGGSSKSASMQLTIPDGRKECC